MRARGMYRALAVAGLAGVAFSVGTAAAQDLPDPGIPAVEVPSVPLPPPPSLPAPQLPAPSLPAPQLPAAPVPAAPSLSPSLEAPATPGSTAPATPGSTAPAPSGSSGAAAGGSGTGGGSAGTPSSGVANAATGAHATGYEHAGARAQSGNRRRAGRDIPAPAKRLRATVRRLRGCLDGLPRAERRVLLLRAGVGPRPVRSRAQVAERLDTSVPRVARIERRGLRRLRALERNEGCGAGPILHAASPAAFPMRSAGPPRAPVVSALAVDTLGRADDATGTGGATPQSGAKDAFDSSPPTPPATAIMPEDGATIGDPRLFLALIALGLLAYAMARRHRSIYRL